MARAEEVATVPFTIATSHGHKTPLRSYIRPSQVSALVPEFAKHASPTSNTTVAYVSLEKGRKSASAFRVWRSTKRGPPAGIASNGDDHLIQLAAQDGMLALDVDGFDRYFIWPRCCHAGASFHDVDIY